MAELVQAPNRATDLTNEREVLQIDAGGVIGHSLLFGSAGAGEVLGAATATGIGLADLSATVTAAGAGTATGSGSISIAGGVVVPGAATGTGVGTIQAAAVVTAAGAAAATGRGLAECTAWVAAAGAATATGRGFVVARLVQANAVPLARHFGTRSVQTRSTGTRSCDAANERTCGARRLS